jgi:energy-coupling factor transporter ATP-binding protein EcfA2
MKADAKSQSKLFIGPYAEGGLSGLAMRVSDELQLYGANSNASPWNELLHCKLGQPVSTLSGGEQVLLALSCVTGIKGLAHVGIDGGLEQLDATNRDKAIEFLRTALLGDSAVSLIDNRMPEGCINGASSTHLNSEKSFWPFNFEDLLVGRIFAPNFPKIELRKISFSYPKSKKIFDDFSLTLTPGSVYQLTGDNGVGKSTLLKLICGVLKPLSGSITLDGMPYEPFQTGNRLMSYATQNPDDQWTSTSLLGDVTTRVRALEFKKVVTHSDGQSLISRFQDYESQITKLPTAGSHLLDYPRAFRKRLSLVWPLLGALPWLAFDEPTLGQDDDAVLRIGQCIQEMIERGYGIIFVSHDERLLSAISQTKPIRLNLID